MKKSQLQELISLISRKLLKEYSALSSTSTKDSNTNIPTDTMTDSEKRKAEREAEANKLRDIRTTKMDLDGTKTQTDYFNQQVKMNKLKKIAQEKELQNLKAGKEISKGGAGSISLS